MRASRGGSLALPAFLGPTHENLSLTSTLPPFWLNPARKLDRSSGVSTSVTRLSRACDVTAIRATSAVRFRRNERPASQGPHGFQHRKT
jgi:hypothetical protein